MAGLCPTEEGWWGEGSAGLWDGQSLDVGTQALTLRRPPKVACNALVPECGACGVRQGDIQILCGNGQPLAIDANGLQHRPNLLHDTRVCQHEARSTMPADG